MQGAVVTFLRKLVADQPGERHAGPIALRVVQDMGIGRVDRSRVRYTPQDHVKARNLLTTQGFPVEAPAPGRTRSQAEGAASEKSGAAAVTQRLVAVVPMNMPDGARCAPGGFVAMPGDQALDSGYDVLLVCENLEALLQIHEYTWLAGFLAGRRCLALYRGGPRMFGTDAAAALITADKRPTLAFFDFDPKGLSMAASLPRREALCLPPWELLAEHARRHQRTVLYTNSYHHSRPHLDGVEDPEIALAWRRMRSLATGLNQEGFPR